VHIANRAGALLLGSALVVLLFMVLVIRRDDAIDDSLEVASDHIDAVRNTADATLSALKDAETGQRGFLITGQDSYLAPHDSGLREFDAGVLKLSRLTAGEPALALLVSRLAELARLKRAEMAQSIRLFRTQGQAAALAKVSEDSGQAYMDQVREIGSRIDAIEKKAYAQTRRAAAQSETATRWKTFFSVVILFLLTFAGTLLLTMEARTQRRLAATLEASEKKYRELAGNLEDQVAARTRELRQLNEELTTFSYSVSHDLRAPLRSIDGFSQIMLEDYSDRLDEDGRRMLKRIRDAAGHMGQLIHSLLQLARVTRQELDLQPVSISGFANLAIQHLLTTHPERKVEISVTPGMRAEGDPNLLRIVIDNLLENAWKFTAKTESARIEVGQVEIEGKPVYFVRDNGSGFDPEHAGKLFRPFQRLHSHAEFAGDGIGLAAVQRVVNRHGGRVWAEGRPNQGAAIFFALS
jgi:signal transduction histidine kinase